MIHRISTTFDPIIYIFTGVAADLVEAPQACHMLFKSPFAQSFYAPLFFQWASIGFNNR